MESVIDTCIRVGRQNHTPWGAATFPQMLREREIPHASDCDFLIRTYILLRIVTVISNHVKIDASQILLKQNQVLMFGNELNFFLSSPCYHIPCYSS